MFIDKWKPVFAIDEGLGSDPGGDAPPPPPDNLGPGSGRTELRKQLEGNFEADRKATEAKDAKEPAAKRPRRVAGGADLEEAPEKAPLDVEVLDDDAEKAPQPPVGAAPEGFSKEAKAEWAKAPPAVQAAVIKREADMAKGVEELKGRYASIDRALMPHMDAIRRNGHTPDKAIEQLFGWFQALATNPDVAFPALAKSFNFQLGAPAPADGKPVDGKPPEGSIPPELKEYVAKLEQKVDGLTGELTKRFGTIESSIQQQSEAKTQEFLGMWAKDKPYYEEARGLMAHLIGSGAVPLKDGKVDLDGAYEMAVYALPDVRAKLTLAEQEKATATAKAKADAERNAQQGQADKARKAAVSVGTGAPGSTVTIAGKPQAKRKSVRESLMEARDELSS